MGCGCKKDEKSPTPSFKAVQASKEAERRQQIMAKKNKKLFI